MQIQAKWGWGWGWCSDSNQRRSNEPRNCQIQFCASPYAQASGLAFLSCSLRPRSLRLSLRDCFEVGDCHLASAVLSTVWVTRDALWPSLPCHPSSSEPALCKLSFLAAPLQNPAFQLGHRVHLCRQPAPSSVCPLAFSAHFSTSSLTSF